MSDKNLKSIISKDKKFYPEDEELWVEFYTDLPMGVATKIDIDDQAGAALVMITSMVCDWNFADVDGSKLPIDDEGVSKLPVHLAEWIVEEINSFVEVDQSKKKDN